MTDRVVRIVASSRLHFGMLSVNQPQTRRFGGVGAMVDAPGLELTIRPAARFEAAGAFAERVLQVARRAVQCFHACEGADGPPCRIEVLRAPPLHVGLGTGTQLALAVAAGLNAWLGRPLMTPDALALCTGRGRRSAIGLYGFAHGGLLYEAGKADEDEVAPLVGRADLPPAWRLVLVRPPAQLGLSEEAERDAFASLPPVPVERTEAMRNEAAEHLLPAAAAGRFDEFSESLYRFGYLAGLGFSARQGGAFNGQRLTALVQWLRSCGIRGVGQSSWGPTLFAVVPNASAASDLVAELGGRPDADSLEVIVAAPANRGACVEVVSD